MVPSSNPLTVTSRERARWTCALCELLSVALLLPVFHSFLSVAETYLLLYFLQGFRYILRGIFTMLQDPRCSTSSGVPNILQRV